MQADWADGDHVRTAAWLEPAAEVLAAAAGIGPGDRVLPDEGFGGRLRAGAADALPFPDDACDAVLSAFGVILLLGRGDRAPWTDPGRVRALVMRHTAGTVRQRGGAIRTWAASPDAWFEDLSEHHPVWRLTRRIGGHERFGRLRRASLAVLRQGNEDPGGFLATERYSVTVSRATARPA